MGTTEAAIAATRRVGLDGPTRTRVFRMFRRLLSSEVGGKARALLLLLLLFLIGINGLNVVNSYVGRDFMTALEQRVWPHFVALTALYLAVFALSTAVAVFQRFTEETLALTWREWLAGHAVGRYLQPPIYHRLSDRLIANGEVANPDQRITDDVRAFTATSLSFSIMLLNGGFTIVAFSGVLWSISPLLLVAAIAYAALGSLLAVLWGRPLVGLNVAQFDLEADFRAELIHVRENADQLAVARREDRLRDRLRRRLDDLVANYRRIIKVNRKLGFFTTGFGYLIPIIPVLIVAPLFFRGRVEFGVVTQSAMAFAQLVGAFSLIINQFQAISSFAAVVTRLGVLDEALEQAESRPVRADEVCPHHSRTETCPSCAPEPHPTSYIDVVDSGEDCRVAFERLTLLSPSNGRMLLRALDGSVGRGTRLRIAGPNDEAKAALFRATAGTWAAGSGRIRRPGDQRMLFLAERPYLPPGTLREALTNSGAATPPEEKLLEALRAVDLEPLPGKIGGLDVERRWDNILSLGEQRRVAFAHVLLTSPCFAFLEHPGHAIPPEVFGRILDRLAERSISVILIAGPDDDGISYTAELRIENDGAWRWTTD
jgi:putative ATP-binding cassette transporter